MIIRLCKVVKYCVTTFDRFQTKLWSYLKASEHQSGSTDTGLFSTQTQGKYKLLKIEIISFSSIFHQ